MKPICLVGDASSKSGVGKYIRTLMAGLGDGDVTTLNTMEIQPASTQGGGAGVVQVSRRTWRQVWLGALLLFVGYTRELLRIAGLIRQQVSPDAILHVNHMGCEVDAIAARFAGRRRIVGTLHVLPGTDPASQFWLRRLIEYASLWSAGQLIAISEAVAQAWAKRVHMAPDRIPVIYNGVEPALPPTRELVPKGLDREFVVGTTGRLHPLKGQDSIIRAFSQLPRLLRDRARVVIVGDGPYRDTLLALADEKGVLDRVDFKGYVDDPRLLLRSFDVFVTASRYEGMSLSLAEAMMEGIPCVITESGGMTELIRKSGGGLTVPIGNEALLAAAMAFYLRHPDVGLRDGQRARDFALRHLTDGAMCQQTAKVYEAIR